jgi:hypothetical protein
MSVLSHDFTLTFWNAVLRKTFTPPLPHPHPKPKKWAKNFVKKPNKDFSNVTLEIWISSNRYMKCAPEVRLYGNRLKIPAEMNNANDF